jgi:oligopeptide transport system substrate-binding protein
MKTIIHYWLPCLLFLAIFTGCSSDHLTRVEVGNEKQILHIGNGDEPADVDPHVTVGKPEGNLQYAIFEGLVARNPNTLEVVPGVAESWQVSDDLMLYTFKIRENARWSNGDPLTAEDFVWSWKRALMPALGNQYAYSLFVIKNAEAFYSGKIEDFAEVGVKALDPHTLQVELNSPTSYFLQLLDHHSMYPVHRETIEKFGAADERGTEWTRPENFVGNGPFTTKKWSPNEVFSVEKNPKYWDADSIKLSEIHFYPVQQFTTEERMFRAGQLHIINELPIQKIATYRRENSESLRSFPMFSTYFYLLNVTRPPLNDVRVRKALAYSIDRESLTENVTKGGEPPAYNLTPPNTNGYTAQAKMPFDIALARELLAQAGYPGGKGFPELTIIYNTTENHQKIAETLQYMWKQALNIDVTLQNQDWKVFLANQRTMNYQISRSGWGGDYYDPNTFLDMFVTDGGNNDTGWSNARYDELIELAARAKTQKERYQYFQEAEAILVDEVPIIPMYTYTRNRLIHPSVKNWHSNILERWSYKNVYLEPQASD